MALYIVETGYLVFLMVGVFEVCFCSSCLQYLNKIIDLLLLVVFQLQTRVYIKHQALQSCLISINMKSNQKLKIYAKFAYISTPLNYEWKLQWRINREGYSKKRINDHEFLVAIVQLGQSAQYCPCRLRNNQKQSCVFITFLAETPSHEYIFYEKLLWPPKILTTWTIFFVIPQKSEKNVVKWLRIGWFVIIQNIWTYFLKSLFISNFEFVVFNDFCPLQDGGFYWVLTFNYFTMLA